MVELDQVWRGNFLGRLAVSYTTESMARLWCLGRCFLLAIRLCASGKSGTKIWPDGLPLMKRFLRHIPLVQLLLITIFNLYSVNFKHKSFSNKYKTGYNSSKRLFHVPHFVPNQATLAPPSSNVKESHLDESARLALFLICIKLIWNRGYLLNVECNFYIFWNLNSARLLLCTKLSRHVDTAKNIKLFDKNQFDFFVQLLNRAL